MFWTFYGESDSLNVETKKMEKLGIIKEYSSKDTFNAKETELFYKPSCLIVVN